MPVAWYAPRPMLLAMLSGLLAFVFLDGLAHAQPLVEIAAGMPPIPIVVDFTVSLAELGTRFALLSIAVLGVVGVFRWLLPRAFSPSPATEVSVFLCRLTALVVGMVLGIAGLGALAACVSGPPSVTWLVRVLDGFLVTAVAAYGRDFITSGGRVVSDALHPVDPPTPL